MYLTEYWGTCPYLTNERRCRTQTDGAGGAGSELLQAHVGRWAAVHQDCKRGTWAKYQASQGPSGLPELPEMRTVSGSFPPRGQTTPKRDPSRPRSGP